MRNQQEETFSGGRCICAKPCNESEPQRVDNNIHIKGSFVMIKINFYT